MTEAKAVTAQFQAQSFSLTVTRAGNGIGSVAASSGGLLCGVTCSATYAGGSSVTLTATAGTNSRFAGWSGACTGTGACVVSMTASRSVTATFEVSRYLSLIHI